MIKVLEVDYLWRVVGQNPEAANLYPLIESDTRLSTKELDLEFSFFGPTRALIIITFSDYASFLECLKGLERCNSEVEPTVQTHDVYERYSVIVLSPGDFSKFLCEVTNYELLVTYELLQSPSINLGSGLVAADLVETLIKLIEQETVLVWGDVKFMNLKRGDWTVKWQM